MTAPTPEEFERHLHEGPTLVERLRAEVALKESALVRAHGDLEHLRAKIARVESLADVWGKHEPAEGMSPIRAHAALTTVLEG